MSTGWSSHWFFIRSLCLPAWWNCDWFSPPKKKKSFTLHVSHYTCLDTREKSHLPLSFHHLAWFWCARVPRVFPQLFVQGSRVWLIRAWEWASCGALQCRDWPIRDILSGWHLLGPGKRLPFKPDPSSSTLLICIIYLNKGFYFYCMLYICLERLHLWCAHKVICTAPDSSWPFKVWSILTCMITTYHVSGVEH